MPEASRARSKRWPAILLAAVIVVAAGLAGIWFGFVSQPAIAGLATPPPSSAFSKSLVETGASLAAAGDCSTCHTAPGGRDLAGGAPVPTPFGLVYSTNITPDRRTGVGSWSQAAFDRAMTRGVARDGTYLYPAFPYDHFTRIRESDLRALYAYLMTRPAASQRNRPDSLAFPFSVRPLMAFWNLLFLKTGPEPAEPKRSAQWNRGRYLVDGVAHCGACHTPRNFLGAVKTGEHLEGGSAENWLAPALGASSPDPAPWTASELYDYLKNGFQANHSFAAGPMGPVVADMRRMPDQDVRAVADYVASLQPKPSPQRLSQARDLIAKADAPGLGLVNPQSSTPTAQLYAGACGWCHYNGAESVDFFASRQKIALGVGANAPDPRNLLHVIVNGISPRPGRPSPIMPGFGDSLTHAQIADLAAYIRSHFTTKPAWPHVSSRLNAISRSKAARTD